MGYWDRRWRKLQRAFKRVSFKRLSPNYRRIERLEGKIKRLERIVVGLTDMGQGERQIATSLDDVRPDHLGRYEFAATYLKPDMAVLDIACGIGYGSYILAQTEPTAHVLGVDISQEALDFGARHFKRENIEFRCGDCLADTLPGGSFDLAVSFETIEHVDGDQVFFGRIFDALKPGGRFVCSTPNQAVMPFSAEKYPFHRRHYTLKEITTLLESNGFEIEKICSQYFRHEKDVTEGGDGPFHVIVSRKP